MVSSPGTVHQLISGKLSFRLADFFKNQHPEVFFAPFDVRLPAKNQGTVDEAVRSVVQPDICGCVGAPDLVVEILLPGNSKTEMHNKFDLYEESGVREYWLVEPSQNAVLVYVLADDGKYIGLPPAVNVLKSTIFPELEIDLKQIFS